MRLVPSQSLWAPAAAAALCAACGSEPTPDASASSTGGSGVATASSSSSSSAAASSAIASSSSGAGAGGAGGSGGEGGAGPEPVLCGAMPFPTLMSYSSLRGATVAVGPTHLVWLEPGPNVLSEPEGVVMAIPRCGGVGAPLAEMQAFPIDLVIDGLDVFWTNFGHNPGGTVIDGWVGRAKLGGLPVAMTTENDHKPTGIAVDETYVYWTTYGEGICRLPRDATGVMFPETLIDVFADAVATDESHVYWLGGGVGRATKDGASPTTLFDGGGCGGSGLGSLVLDATDIYIFDRCDSIYRIPKAGGDPILLAEGQTGPTIFPAHRLAVDDQHVYWVNETSLMRVVKTGGPLETLAPAASSDLGDIGGVALSETHVYWSAYMEISFMSKP